MLSCQALLTGWRKRPVAGWIIEHVWWLGGMVAVAIIGLKLTIGLAFRRLARASDDSVS